MKMFRLPEHKVLFKQQLLTAARDDLIGHFETMVSGYEQQICRQQKLLEVVLKSEMKLRRAEIPADVQQLVVVKEEVPSEQQEWSPSLHHDLQVLFKRQLLTAAREDLIGHFEMMISGYEKEIDRRQKLLDVILQPEIKLRRVDVQQLLVVKEEKVQQEWSPSLDQDPEPPYIKEEQEEVWSSQEGEQLRGLEEDDITKFTFTPVPVKSEDDEEKPQSSQLHQRQTEQMEADGEDCGGPEPARSSDTEDQTEDSSETDKDWMDRDRKSFCCSVCGKTFEHRGNLNIHTRTHTGVKPFSCSLCGKRFTQKAGLDYHLKTHTGERPFSCSICGKTYRHKGALTYHMATHTGVKPYSCSDCGKRFRGTSQLKIHKCVSKSSQRQRDEHNKPLSCPECDATFPNNYLLTTHIRMHKGKKLFTCTICGKKRQFSSHLEIHMRTHTGEKPYSCSVCGKRFSQRGIMTQHMAVHSGVKPYSCSVCGRRFFWQYQVKKHKCQDGSSQRRRTGFNGAGRGGSEPVRIWNPERLLKPGADKETKSLETEDNVDVEFWKETRQHQSGFTYQRTKRVSASGGNNTDKKPSSCSDDMAETEPRTNNEINIDLCTQTWLRQSGLNHLNTEEIPVSHTGSKTDKKPFSSSVHQIRSEVINTLQMYRKCHTGEKTFTCLFCGKGFATGGFLTRHISVHIGEKLLRCIVCENTFMLESELVSHECVGESSQLQTANKPFSCSQCGKGFSRKHNLQVHMRTHAGEKPFGCSVCAKTFARRESLSVHMTCHTGEKPFHCSVCNTDFIDSESLIKHMRIHTRQTQFSCSICGKEFAWRRYLTKHMEVHAKEKLYRCRVCDRGFAQIHQLSYHQCVSREEEPPASSSAEQMETEADGEDCGGPEPARNSDPLLQLDTEDSSDLDGDDDWEETREPQAGSDSLEQTEVSQSDGTPFSCSECGETFNTDHLLKIHMRNHPGEKLFSCSICEERFTERGSLSQHMEVHTGVHRGAKQEDPDPEPPHIKEEQEEVWISQEEADITKFTFTPVPVKSEDDDEEKPQSSQLHQRQTEQMEADGEDCGGPEPARNSHPDPDTDDSVDSDFWKETRERPLNNDEISESIMGCDSGQKELSCSDDKASESLEPESDDSVDSDFWKDNRKPQETRRKPYSCSECGKKFLLVHHLKNHMRFHAGKKAVFFCSVCGQECLYKSHLKIHMRTHTGEKPFVCPVCGKKYAHKASMQSHMVIHTVENQYTCSICDKSFGWFTELKYHQCVGESSHEAPRWRETSKEKKHPV